MTTWEHRAVRIAVEHAEHVERELTRFGREGWQLVALVPLGGIPPYALAAFKRQRERGDGGGGVGGLSD